MELIVEDAVIITMAGDAAPDRAMLVRDGRIAATGAPEQVRAAAGPGAQVVRLDGATVVPGLIDAHCHVADVGYLAAAADCSQPSAPDIPAIQARLRSAAGRTPAGSWVTGGGYVEYKLREGRHPTRDDLDQAVPDRPAVVYHTSLHACVLNTAALREAGFADQQPDPAGGVFGRDRDGRLDGVVFERPMFELFERNLRQDLARMGSAERNRLVERASQQLASFGLTATCDADLRRDSFGGYASADAAGVLGVRIYGLVVHDQVPWLLDEGLRGRHSGRLAAEAVKIWADGGMSSRTAAIHGSYPVPPYGSGILYFELDELTDMVRSFDALRDAMLRRTDAGRVLGPGEELTALDALALYTTQAAFASRREHEIGSLEPGKLADFTVLDANPLEVEPERITDVQVVATVLDGAPVYQSGDIFPGGCPVTALRNRRGRNHDGPSQWRRRGVVEPRLRRRGAAKAGCITL